MARYAHIIANDVVNVVEIDPASSWRPDGGYVVQTDVAGVGWRYEGGVFSDPNEPPPPLPPTRWLVRKVTILRRVNQAGKLAEAFSKLGGPGSFYYELWQAAAPESWSDDEEMVQLLGAMGLDPAVILAPE